MKKRNKKFTRKTQSPLNKLSLFQKNDSKFSMSPFNFSLEYLFLFERKEYHLPSLELFREVELTPYVPE